MFDVTILTTGSLKLRKPYRWCNS